MRFFIQILAFSFLILSCNSEVKRDGYVIRGNAKGIYNGIRVYLKSFDQNNRPIDLDTAVVMNEKFSFVGKVSTHQMCFLSFNSINGTMPIILENAEIWIDVNTDNLFESSISGSKTNEGLMAFNKNMVDLNNRRQEIGLALREAAQTNEIERTNALNKELSDINNQMMNGPFDFITNNNDNFYSLILIESMLRRRNADLKKTIESFDGLVGELKASPKGKEVLAQVESAKLVLEAEKKTAIGEIAPDFSAPTPEGKILSLNDVKGKVTMIDFWAAWCGPCRRENPNIVQVYNKYHEKGLEIIGVSMDGRMGQGDPKEAWVKAIEDDNLTWHQISNLKYFEGPIAKMYNLQSIPASFILDADGRIVAKNLRGPALEQKISELLD